jgi:hypothetical protein
MAGGSIRAAAKAAVIGGYRSAAYMRRVVTPSSHTSSADGRKASTFAADDWVITDREVFGPVPTHEEALAATLDLKDAFEMSVLSLAHIRSLCFSLIDVSRLCICDLFISLFGFRSN